MNTINASNARANLYQLISDVNKNSQPVLITNSKGQNAVLIGEDDWKVIEETLSLASVSGMTESIIKGINTPLEECLPENKAKW